MSGARWRRREASRAALEDRAQTAEGEKLPMLSTCSLHCLRRGAKS